MLHRILSPVACVPRQTPANLQARVRPIACKTKAGNHWARWHQTLLVHAALILDSLHVSRRRAAESGPRCHAIARSLTFARGPPRMQATRIKRDVPHGSRHVQTCAIRYRERRRPATLRRRRQRGAAKAFLLSARCRPRIAAPTPPRPSPTPMRAGGAWGAGERVPNIHVPRCKPNPHDCAAGNLARLDCPRAATGNREAWAGSVSCSRPRCGAGDTANTPALLSARCSRHPRCRWRRCGHSAKHFYGQLRAPSLLLCAWASP